MSDFDKFLGDKLDEESQFPRRDQNWERLAHRLDVFDAMSQPAPTAPRSLLRFWQVAAAAALLVAGALFLKMSAVQREKAEMQQQIEALQKKNVAATPLPMPMEQLQSMPGQENNQATDIQIRLQHPSTLPTTGATPVRSIPSSWPPQTTPSAPQKEGVTGRADVIATEQIRPGSNANDPNIPPRPGATDWPTQAPVSAGANDLTSLPPSKTGDDAAVKSGQTPLSVPTSDGTTPQNAVAATAGLPPQPETIPSNAPALKPDLPQDSLLQLATRRIADSTAQGPQANAAVSPPPATDTLGIQTATPPPVIQPVRYRPRIQAGVQAVVGATQPNIAGVSPITGQGLTAEFSPFRNIWVTTSVDWLRFEVSTEKFFPRFHSHHTKPEPPNSGPGPNPGPKHELVKVESSQRHMQYALGLRYALPVHGWLRPSVRAAHTWTRVAPGFVSFEFDEPGQGPGGKHDPEYLVQKEKAQNLRNIWRLGAGVEHDVARWSFGLWADYSKNLAATDDTFDALYLQAGVKYRL